MTDASGPPESSVAATTDKTARRQGVVHNPSGNGPEPAAPAPESDNAAASGLPETGLSATTDKNARDETAVHSQADAEPTTSAGVASGPLETGLPATTNKNARDKTAVHSQADTEPTTSGGVASGSLEIGLPDKNVRDTTAVHSQADAGPTTSAGVASGPPKSSLPAATDKNVRDEAVVHSENDTGAANPSDAAGTGVRAASGPPKSSVAAGTDKTGRVRGVVHRFLPSPDSRLGRFIQRVQPDEEKFRSPAHHEKVTARVGLWLGIAFLLCFLTGLSSHLIQHPPSWFVWPARPANLYRITQGVHVISGIAAIPLLLAKLWSVYPKLFSRPVVRSLPHALERLSILVLSGAAFFELATGLFNATQNYPWGFYFLGAHYAVAWIAIGSVLLHIAVKLPVVRRGFAPVDASRRAFLRTTFLATGVAVVATAGATVPLLRTVSPLSWRSDRGPQGVPVNRTAAAARVTVEPEWRLEIVARTGVTRLSLAQLRALPQRTAELPIACVEGWSQSASWTGVPIADLVELVGAPEGSEVHVTSLERRGAYRTSTLPGTHTRDPETLLALRLNGETLALDHGFPCRIIAPSRPGVLQTKWVHRLEVL